MDTFLKSCELFNAKINCFLKFNQWGIPEKFVVVKYFNALSYRKKLDEKIKLLSDDLHVVKIQRFAIIFVKIIFPLYFLVKICFALFGFSVSKKLFVCTSMVSNLENKILLLKNEKKLVSEFLDKLEKSNNDELPSIEQYQKEKVAYDNWKLSIRFICSIVANKTQINDWELVYNHYMRTFKNVNDLPTVKCLVDFASLQLDFLSLLKYLLPEKELQILLKALEEEKAKRNSCSVSGVDVDKILQSSKYFLDEEQYKKLCAILNVG